VRLILAGQKAFGREALKAIRNAGHEVPLVVAPADEGDALWRYAFGTGEVTITSLTEDWVRSADADLIVAAHSHTFIGRRSRAATRLGAIGYHPSLLPRHRGRDAVRWTVAMGDPVAGGSVYWFTDNVDGGPIAAQDWCFVRPGEDYRSLWRDKLFPMGLDLLLRVLKDLDNGVLVAVPQSEEAGVATWEPSWDRPPMHRPELPELGTVAGYEVRAARGAER